MRGLYQFERIRLPPVSNGRPLCGHHLRQFMRLTAGERARSAKAARQPFDGRERVTNFVRDARRQMPHRTNFSLRYIASKQFSAVTLITLMPKTPVTLPKQHRR